MADFLLAHCRHKWDEIITSRASKGDRYILIYHGLKYCPDNTNDLYNEGYSVETGSKLLNSVGVLSSYRVICESVTNIHTTRLIKARGCGLWMGKLE